MVSVPTWRRCTAPDVWLPPLADRLVRLALQLLARYATWLRAGLEARSSAAYSTDPAQPAQVRVPALHAGPDTP